jgi:hypothetical protein
MLKLWFVFGNKIRNGSREAMKNAPLKVGQIVFIENINYNYLGGGQTSHLHKAEIVEANKSSAYAVRKTKEPLQEKPYRYRIDQRKKNLIGHNIFGFTSTLWLSEEDYLAHIKYKSELEEHKQTLVKAVKECKNLEKLKSALAVLNDK